MALDTWFESVWDALVTQITTITEFGTSKVFYTKKNPVAQFPAAYVHPSIADGAPKTFKESVWSPTFNVYIVVENADPKAGVMAAWKLGWKVVDKLYLDRTLGGLLHNLECGPLLDSPEGMGRGLEQHWIVVPIRCSKKM